MFLLLFLHVARLPMPPTPSPHIHAAPWHAPAKEHVENFFSCHVTLEPMTRIFVFIESATMVTTPRRSRCLLLFITAIEIVLPSLSFVRKNCIGVADGLECLRSSWRFVLVRMKCQCKFPVSFLEIGIAGVLGKAKDLVIVFTSPHTFHCLHLLLCEVLGQAAGAGLLIIVALLSASLPLPPAAPLTLLLLTKAHLLH